MVHISNIADIKGVKEEWQNYFFLNSDRATAIIIKHGEPYEIIHQTDKAILVIMQLQVGEEAYHSEEVWIPKKWLDFKDSD